MKVPAHIVEERRRQLADYLQGHAYVPLEEVCKRFHIPAATARRDLAVLATRKQVVRTPGGALSEYHRRFPSFRKRRACHVSAKQKIAAAAHQVIRPDTTGFLDFGTTIFALAEERHRRPVAGLRIVTNNLPVAELLIAAPAFRVYLLGGELLARQSVLLGGQASKALRFYAIDQAFLSAEAADATGVWNSQDELVSIQRKALEASARNVLCLDASKFKHTAPALLSPWRDFDLLITDAKARQLGEMEIADTLYV